MLPYGHEINKDVHFENFKDKVVEKSPGSSCGISVRLHDLPLQKTKPCKIYQQYIECGGVDERWIIVGDKIVCAMQRKSVSDDEFRANLSVGGVGTPIEITEDMQEFAKKIIDVFEGYLYAGIDIITDKDGNRYFLEANVTPGTKIVDITNHNFFDDVYKYIIENI